jgi:hypothetical protein
MTRDDNNDTNITELDTLLSDHLHRRLDGQLGRATAAFDQLATQSPSRGRPPTRFAFATAGLIAAAVVAIAWALWPRTAIRPHPTPPTVATVAAAAPTPDTADTPRELERLVLWQTYDEGAGVFANQLPVRKLRQEGVEQVEFYLPDERATVKVTVPLVRNVMVQMETY